MTNKLSDALTLRVSVEAFLAEYMLAIDEDRLEEWHDFFVEDGSYRITTRENMELGLPLNLMSCKGHGMFKDRIVAMREIVPAATAKLTLTGEHAGRDVTLATVLPMAQRYFLF